MFDFEQDFQINFTEEEITEEEIIERDGIELSLSKTISEVIVEDDIPSTHEENRVVLLLDDEIDGRSRTHGYIN